MQLYKTLKHDQEKTHTLSWTGGLSASRSNIELRTEKERRSLYGTQTKSSLTTIK